MGGGDELGAARACRRRRSTGDIVGGQLIRRCTSRAPAALTIFTIFRLVVPAHERVVQQDDALALENAADRVQLDLDAEVPDRLLRLDEGPADVVVADQPHPHRQLRLFREADRGADAGVGDRHDDVGVGRRFARQDAAELRAHLVDAAAEDVAVGPREVDVLEHAVRERLRRERLDRPQPAVADDEQLARLDVADVGGANQVERAGLGTDDPGVAEPAERQRAEAVWDRAAAISRFFVSSASEYAPRTWAIDSMSASSTDGAFDRA